MSPTDKRQPRSRALAVDKYAGLRMRERRILLGLTQQQMAELIGVTYQQAHKYENGINRMAAGRLYAIATVLGVTTDYFFEGLETGAAPKIPAHQRLLLELAQNFIRIPNRKQQDALCALARTLATLD